MPSSPPFRRFPKWVSPCLHEGPSRIAGRGVFTHEPVRAEEVLMRWGGLLIPYEAYDPHLYRPSSTTLYDEAHYLVTPVHEPKLLDEWLNHSCDPNTWMGDEVTMLARRDLSAGEEVTTDFALWNHSDWLFLEQCRCGSPLCRGRITGLDWRRPELQARYRGHFLPCLNRFIANTP